MAIHRCISTLLVTLAIASSVARAESSELFKGHYVIFPITTALQRHLIPAADIYVEFDVKASLRDATDYKIDSINYFSQGFAEDLSLVRDQIGKPSPLLMLYLRYSGLNVSKTERQSIEDAVTEMCKLGAVSKVRHGARFEGGTWSDKVASLGDWQANTKADADESSIEDEIAQVFPVRTALSRFLLANADCLVELRQPIDSRFKGFSESTRRSIAKAVDQLGISEKHLVSFHVIATTAGTDVAHAYFQGRDSKPAPSDEFIKELGFARATCAVTPMGVSAEDLLGKPAPDFTLDALAGGQIHLQDAIRGRAAVITFWGVACGSCRVEAPHLTALRDKYSADDLAVVAVNAYNETRDDIEKFARDAKLTHPIALQGRKVAEKKYTVTSYPVTFFVDRQGTIVDYHLGFDAGDEKVFGTTVERLIAADKAPDNAPRN